MKAEEIGGSREILRKQKEEQSNQTKQKQRTR
jgi:hypothetical protein